VNACDVLVVGGGPAGSTTARLLALQGWKVRLLDRSHFPRPKPCGECLNPGAVAALARLGVLDDVLALEPASLGGWVIGTPPGGSARFAARPLAVARGRFPPGHSGLSIDRARLDHALLAAAQRAGVEVEEGRRVRTGDPVLTTAPVVVGADGLRSVVGRAARAYRRAPRLRKLSITVHVEGVALDPREGCIRLDALGTVGLAPLDPRGARWNATVVVDARGHGRAVAGDPGGFALARVVEVLAPAPRPRAVAGPWTSGPFDWPGRRAVMDGVVLVGDAAGYFDPLTGQGIFRALRSAELAADAIDTALRAGRAFRRDLDSYERALRRELSAPLRVQRGVEAVISRGPLRRGAIRLLGRRPRPMNTLIAVTGDLESPRALLRPALWADLLSSRHAG
jgi:flavin-dependent dehydrogenase